MKRFGVLLATAALGAAPAASGPACRGKKLSAAMRGAPGPRHLLALRLHFSRLGRR